MGRELSRASPLADVSLVLEKALDTLDVNSRVVAHDQQRLHRRLEGDAAAAVASFPPNVQSALRLRRAPGFDEIRELAGRCPCMRLPGTCRFALFRRLLSAVPRPLVMLLAVGFDKRSEELRPFRQRSLYLGLCVLTCQGGVIAPPLLLAPHRRVPEVDS